MTDERTRHSDRGRRWTFAVAVSLVAVAALLAGFVVSDEVEDTITTPVVVVGPSELPPLPSRFPAVEQRYLDGVTVSQISDDWLASTGSWICADAENGAHQARHALECGPEGPDGNATSDVTITIEYDDEAQVVSLSGTCLFQPEQRACRSLFAELAGVALAGEPDLRRKATRWARRHMQQDTAAVIGGVHVWTPVGTDPSIYIRPAA